MRVGGKLAPLVAASTVALAFAGLGTQGVAAATSVTCGGSANGGGANETCSIVDTGTNQTSPPYAGTNAYPPLTCSELAAGSYKEYFYEPVTQIPWSPPFVLGDEYAEVTEPNGTLYQFTEPAGFFKPNLYYYERFTETYTATSTPVGPYTDSTEWITAGQATIVAKGVTYPVPDSPYVKVISKTKSWTEISKHIPSSWKSSCSLGKPMDMTLVTEAVGVSCDPNCVPKGGSYSDHIAEAQQWRLSAVTSNPPAGSVTVWLGTQFHANFSVDPGVGTTNTSYPVALGNGRTLDASISVSILPYSFNWHYTASGAASGSGFSCTFSTFYEVGGDSSIGGSNDPGACSSPNAGEPSANGYIFTHDAQSLTVVVTCTVQVSAAASWVDNTGSHSETLFAQNVVVPTSGAEQSTIQQVEGQ